MESKPQPDSQFTITASALCYSPLHNIHHDSVSPIQPYPAPEYQPSGSVKVHDLRHNASAQNGVWVTYQLVEFETRVVKAWFACHSAVDPNVAIHKILGVSGSPYEPDNGSTFNTAKTAEECVLVVTRVGIVER
ncbi:hypothetical protein B7463_g7624, partial [Scytalidium lignicola]